MTTYVIKAPRQPDQIADIESLDAEGRGIARPDGKVAFIDGALPGERVGYRTFNRKPTFDLGQVVSILRPSSQRVEPRCPHFGVCGGCSMQHLEPSAQVAVKQRILEDCLWRIGHQKPECLLPAIHGPTWHYRRRARFSVRYVMKKGGVLVGFHEKASSFIAEMETCPVQTPQVSALIPSLRVLINQLSIRDRLPQVEVAGGDAITVLVFRILDPLNANDEMLLRSFADDHGIQVWLQPKGPTTAYPFHPLDAPELSYSLPEFGLTMPFRPTDFTQVNFDINRALIRRAVALLDPQPGERVADFFCGLGNFSLPIARRGAEVFGVEGSSVLVARAAENAARNGLAGRASFADADLFTVDTAEIAAWGHFDKMLIDPPRDGAVELIKALPEDSLPSRIVYVSCSPATLARDAAVLCHTRGYRLRAAGVANMFPHTAHVESIALFER